MKIEKIDGTVEHECKAYKGKIKDVSYRPNQKTIHCRACNKVLSDDEIDPETLKKVKDRIERGKNGKIGNNKTNGKNKSNSK